jgi:hypothetical protein
MLIKRMNMKTISIGYYIIGSALIWGIVIVACAFVLSGTPYKEDVSLILGGAGSFHLLLIWGPLAARIGKLRKEDLK